MQIRAIYSQVTQEEVKETIKDYCKSLSDVDKVSGTFRTWKFFHFPNLVFFRFFFKGVDISIFSKFLIFDGIFRFEGLRRFLIFFRLLTSLFQEMTLDILYVTYI